MSLNPIIFGATGMVGEGVLHVALQSDEVASVLVVGRKPCGVQHPKLREIVHPDLFDLSAIEALLDGVDSCFFCLGVSSVGMKEDAYRRITYDLTMHCAETLARRNPAMTFCYVSGTGTDSSEQGRSMWARVKGKTENDLGALPFKAVYNFRPGFIKPMPGMKRTQWFASALAWSFPLWKAVLPTYVCTLEDLGKAMLRVSSTGYPGRILENPDIAAAAR
jgi:uncharacterized protein YbjT (DUF2867 family)